MNSFTRHPCRRTGVGHCGTQFQVVSTRLSLPPDERPRHVRAPATGVNESNLPSSQCLARILESEKYGRPIASAGGTAMPVSAKEREATAHAGVARGASIHDDLVARAQALIPQLRERVVEAEQLRKMPPGSVEAVRKAGLFRVLQAGRYGGHQQS